MTILENGVDRSAQQKIRHHKALIARFRKSMEDRAKLAIISYLETNPAWTPEELKIVINAYIYKYSLNNRYVPSIPKAAVDAAEAHAGVGEESKVEMNADPSGTDGSSGS